MPWKAVGKNIVKTTTGKVVGKSSSHAKAQASVRARYANTNEKSERGERSESRGSERSEHFGHMGVRCGGKKKCK